MDEATTASPDQWKGHRDEIVRDMFHYREVSPEEYVARHSHQIECFSLDRHDYIYPELGNWLRRLGQILRGPTEVGRCRRSFLTQAEYETVQQDVEDTIMYGL